MKENVSGHSVTQETTVILGLLWTMAKHMPLKGLRSSTGMTAVGSVPNMLRYASVKSFQRRPVRNFLEVLCWATSLDLVPMGST